MNLLNIKNMELGYKTREELLVLVKSLNEYYMDKWSDIQNVFMHDVKYKRSINGEESISNTIMNCIRSNDELKNNYSCSLPRFYSTFSLENGLPNNFMVDLEEVKDIKKNNYEVTLNRLKKEFALCYKESLKAMINGYFYNICHKIDSRISEQIDSQIIFKDPFKLFDQLDSSWHKISPFQIFPSYVKNNNLIEQQSKKVNFILDKKKQLKQFKSLDKAFQIKGLGNIKVAMPKEVPYNFKEMTFDSLTTYSRLGKYVNALIFYLAKYHGLDITVKYNDIVFNNLGKTIIYDEQSRSIKSIKTYKNGSFEIKFMNEYLNNHPNLLSKLDKELNN